MPYAVDENIYYESYLQVIRRIGVLDNIAPQTVEDLLRIDIDFLYANYSGWVITTKKESNGWRYREEDKQFSSYYDSNIDHNTGDWEIISSAKNYEEIPSIFAFNMKRIVQQVTFNNKESALRLPEYIYYLAYLEENKNQSIESLFKQKNLEKSNGKLKIRASKLGTPSNPIIENAFTKN